MAFLFLSHGVIPGVFAQDTSEVNTLHQKAWSFRNTNPDSLYYYAKKELALAETLYDAVGKAKAFGLHAVYHQYNADYDQCLEYYQRALEILQKTKRQHKVAATFSNIGSIYFRMSNYRRAMEYYNQALEIEIHLNDSINIATSYADIGMVHTELGNFDKGLEYLFQSFSLSDKLKDTIGVAQCHTNIAVNFFEQKNYVEALKHYQEAERYFGIKQNKRGLAEVYGNIGQVYILQNQKDEALEYFDKAIQQFEELGYKKGIITLFTNMAQVNFQEGELYKARRNCLHALRENITINDREGELDVLLLMGKIELEDYKPDRATDYLKEAMAIAYEIKAKGYIRDVAQELANAYLQQEDHKKAVPYLQLYSAMKDSLLNSQKLQNIARLNANYEMEKQRNELVFKNQEIKLLQKASALERQRTIAASITGLLVIVVVVLVVYRINVNRKNQAQILLKDRQLAESQTALVEAELKTKQKEGEVLQASLTYQNTEIQNFAMHIVEKNQFLQDVSRQIDVLIRSIKEPEAVEKAKELASKVKHHVSIDRERQEFSEHIEKINAAFFVRLVERFPSITEAEKKLTALLHLGLSSKEIASILNISAKSVDMSRYRLRKKFEIEKEESLSDFISKI